MNMSPNKSQNFRLKENRPKEDVCVLKLYVSGTTSRSVRAIGNIKKICDTHLAGRYELEVVDIYQQPALAQGEQIIAVPTLIKKLPAPLRTFIGDLSDTEKVLFGLDLRKKS
jgi:circadian clock protein KaiB